MVKFIFSLGIIDKKLCLPFLVALNQIINKIIEYLYSKYKIQTNMIIDTFSASIGAMLILFIPLIFKYKTQTSLKDAIFNKKNMKYQFILWGINVLLLGLFSSCSLIAIKKNPHENMIYTVEAIQMIFLTVVTIFFLKYKYYIHHIISLILFCVLCIIIDYLIDNFQEGYANKAIEVIILENVLILIEIINYCYKTYMMNNLYYNYWSVVFSSALIPLLLIIGFLIANLCFGNPNEEKNFLNSLFYYFKEVGAGYIVLRIFLQVLFLGFSLEVLKILILRDLTTNHILISNELSKLLNILLYNEHKNKWFTIIPFVFQFLSLMFFLEIFEFNFCKLNKNTKKSILLRENKDMNNQERLSHNSIAEIQDYLINDVNENNENNFEKTIRASIEMQDKNINCEKVGI